MLWLALRVEVGSRSADGCALKPTGAGGALKPAGAGGALKPTGVQAFSAAGTLGMDTLGSCRPFWRAGPPSLVLALATKLTAVAAQRLQHSHGLQGP